MDTTELIERLRSLNSGGSFALEEYLKSRIDQHHKTLETARDDQVVRAQGSVEEIRKLLSIIEYVRQPREQHGRS